MTSFKRILYVLAFFGHHRPFTSVRQLSTSDYVPDPMNTREPHREVSGKIFAYVQILKLPRTPHTFWIYKPANFFLKTRPVPVRLPRALSLKQYPSESPIKNLVAKCPKLRELSVETIYRNVRYTMVVSGTSVRRSGKVFIHPIAQLVKIGFCIIYLLSSTVHKL